MARKPRPIDPTEGPLQAFAHDLRLVREQAGNPTYRALATLAGFSASTLSDAAGGMRRPSLEVTLAYVGACGGDVAAWQQRWEELDRELGECPGTDDECPGAPTEAADEGAQAPAEPAAAATTAPAPSSAAPAPTPAPTSATPLPRRFRPRRRTLLAAGTAAVAAAAVLAALVLPGKSPHRSASPTAPGTANPLCSAPAGAAGNPPATAAGSAPVRFTGLTYGSGAHVHAGASLNADTLWTAPPGCTLQLTGYCLGDVVYDPSGGEPDIRWFELAGGGVVASAIIHGDPPGVMKPSACPDDAPMPQQVSLHLDHPAADGTVQLSATGKQVAIVGYAAYYAAPAPTPTGAPTAGTPAGAPTASAPAGTQDGTSPSASAPPAPGWHQIRLTADQQSSFDYVWRLGPLQGSTTPIPVVAVACLGGDGATTVADAHLLAPDGTAAPTQLTPDQQAVAERAACRYPNPNA
ncbi:helix-turn-helix domain-containing protein [Kitasatospora sp. LaBMicrA B282]|uniref:helix-turn-helix domain-containing protein n=1 Tax=Kitasatospora sp. LaBMicrA B282 TaxID=3420949 RepID=UPI003D0B95A1